LTIGNAACADRRSLSDVIVRRELAMTILRKAAAVLLAVVLLASGAARSASTTNYTDQWWDPLEWGWGASILQQADVLFVDLFVYGPSGEPIWFSAAAPRHADDSAAGHDVFIGDLYYTSGPHYGAPFGSAPVKYAKVGALSFDGDGTTVARLTYIAMGNIVQKQVTRQHLRHENLGGTYHGGFVWDQACGPDGAPKDHVELFGEMQFTHNADNTVALDMKITVASRNGVAETVPSNAMAGISGLYAQSGHMGQFQGTFAYAVGPDKGAPGWNLYEIERSINGITGRLKGLAASPPAPCAYDGRFGGVRR
jgi:hypothetical protein